MDARGNPVYRGRFLASPPESPENQHDDVLGGQMSDHEYFGGYGGDRVGQECPEVEVRRCLERYSRDHGNRRERETFDRGFFADMMESICDSIKGLADAVKPSTRCSGSRDDDSTDTDMVALTIRFKRLHPPHFSGGADVSAAIDWLKMINRYLDILEIPNGAQRVTLATFQLLGSANVWWDVAKESVGDSWKEFEEAFKEQYMPDSAVEELRQQFQDLTQGDMTVTEYAQKFNNLSRYADDLVSTEKRRCCRFEKGLRPSIRNKVVILKLTDFTKLLRAARASERDYHTFKKKKQKQRPRGDANSSGGRGRRGQKRRGSSPDSGSEAPRKLGSSGSSSRGSKCSISVVPFACHLCKQTGHIVARCPKLRQASALVSGSPSQRQNTGGSRTYKQRSVVCHRCDQPGYFANECPTKSMSTGSASTQQSQYRPSGQTFGLSSQSFWGGGRGGGQQRGRMLALEMTEKMSGYQEQPAQRAQYLYPSLTQTYPAYGGGYWSGQMAAMGVAEQPSVYYGQTTQSVRYLPPPPPPPPPTLPYYGVGGYRPGHVAVMEAVVERSTSGRQGEHLHCHHI